MDIVIFFFLLIRYMLQIILVVGGLGPDGIHSVEWYDPAIGQWQSRHEIRMLYYMAGFALTKDCCLFAMGGQNTGSNSVSTVDMYDLTSPSLCRVPTVAMSTCRTYLGVAELDNHIYAVSNIGILFIYKKIIIIMYI